MRFLANFIIRSVLLIIFQAFGWLVIGKTVVLFAVPLLDTLLVAGILGLAFSIAISLIGTVVALLAAGFGAYLGGVDGASGCAIVAIALVALVAGPLALPLVAAIFPGWLSITSGSFVICVMGWALLLIRISESSGGSRDSS